VAHTTDIVVKRKTYNSIQCKDGTVYKLMGTFVDPKNSKYSDLTLSENNECEPYVEFALNLYKHNASRIHSNFYAF
jgi:hypothetical protein